MAVFGTEIFSRLANEVNFKRPFRVDDACNPVDPGCLVKGSLLPDAAAQKTLAGRSLSHEEDIHNFKEALFALVMMRACESLRKSKGGQSCKVNVSFTFNSGAIHPEAKAIKFDKKGKIKDGTGGSGIDTIVSHGQNEPLEIHNLIALFNTGHFALACN